MNALPGFRAVFELGFSDILRTFVQGVGDPLGSGYALRTDGTVWKWESRQVLFGDTFEYVRYVTNQLGALHGVTQLAGGRGNWFALQRDGTVWGWGEDLYEELGLSATDFDTPVQQKGLAGVRSLITQHPDGSGARLALTQVGEVWGWGSNYSGYLGDGTTKDSWEPQRVPGLDGITKIVAGSRCLALQSTGQVWTWGRFFMEAEESEALLRPTNLAGLPPVTSLFVDAATAVDGSFWRWDERSIPWRVPGLRDVRAVVYGGSGPQQPTTHHVLTADGTVWGWGGNSAGQIGDGTILDRSEPVIVEGLQDVTEIAGAFVTRYALTRGGDVYHWGASGGTYDDRGALVWDDPLPTPRRTPLPPASAAAMSDKWMPIPRGPDGSSNSLPPSLFDPTGGKTYLMHYAMLGTAYAVEETIRQGADVNAVDDDGDTALYYAASRGRADNVDLLLDYGADPGIVGDNGSPLHVAAARGRVDIVLSLLSHGADINRQVRYVRPPAGGVTAAMLAAGGGHTEVLRTLCAAGADLNLLDDDGDSVLFYAASRGQVEAVTVLLEQGMDPRPKPGASGQTPLSIATDWANSNGPFPPGTTRSGLAAVVELLTSQRGSAKKTLPASERTQPHPLPSATDDARQHTRAPDQRGCYVATAVYGSYDCPEVWVLRRWRDTSLATTTAGRQFIRLYYSTSRPLVRAVGSQAWFSRLVRRPLDRFVGRLQALGYSSLPYSDRYPRPEASNNRLSAKSGVLAC